MLMAVAAMVGLAPVMSNYPIVAVSPVSLLLREHCEIRGIISSGIEIHPDF